jgi:hypothetical protein
MASLMVSDPPPTRLSLGVLGSGNRCVGVVAFDEQLRGTPDVGAGYHGYATPTLAK